MALSSFYPSDKPGRPEGPLEYSELTDKSVVLSWKQPKTDGGTPITNYVIESRVEGKSQWNVVMKVKVRPPEKSPGHVTHDSYTY